MGILLVFILLDGIVLVNRKFRLKSTNIGQKLI
jgi:hypothetical protein